MTLESSFEMPMSLDAADNNLEFEGRSVVFWLWYFVGNTFILGAVMFSFSKFRQNLLLQQLRRWLNSLDPNEMVCWILITFMNYRLPKWRHGESPGVTFRL